MSREGYKGHGSTRILSNLARSPSSPKPTCPEKCGKISWTGNWRCEKPKGHDGRCFFTGCVIR